MLYNRPFAKLGLKDQLRHIAMQRKKKLTMPMVQVLSLRFQFLMSHRFSCDLKKCANSNTNVREKLFLAAKPPSQAFHQHSVLPKNNSRHDGRAWFGHGLWPH